MTAEEMYDERLTIQEGSLKGSKITPSKADIIELMEEYHAQFELPDGRLKCGKACKWFKIGYGHCVWCIRNVKDGLSDHYEPSGLNQK